MLRESMAFCTSLTRTPREALPDIVIRQRAKSRKPPADKRGRGALIRLLDRNSEARVVHDRALLPFSPRTKFTENGQQLSLGEGLRGITSGASQRPLRRVRRPGGRPGGIFRC